METNSSHRLERGRTCLGRTIFLPETNRQNWARKAASSLSALMKWALERQSYDEELLSVALKYLQRNLGNPIHYGDNKPGWVFGDVPGNPPKDTSVVPDPRFNYYDLFSLGISGEDGYKGFLRDCGLPDSMPYVMVVAATSLLLIDDAVCALDRDDPWYAAWALYQAHDLFDDLMSSESDREALRKYRKKLKEAEARRGPHPEVQQLGVEKAKDKAQQRENELVAKLIELARQDGSYLKLKPEMVKRTIQKLRSDGFAHWKNRTLQGKIKNVMPRVKAEIERRTEIYER